MKKLLFLFTLISCLACENDSPSFQPEKVSYILLKDTNGLDVHVKEIKTSNMTRNNRIVGKRVVGSYTVEHQINYIILYFVIEKNTLLFDEVEWHSEKGIAKNQLRMQSTPLQFTQDVKRHNNILQGFFDGALATNGFNEKIDLKMNFQIDLKQ